MLRRLPELAKASAERRANIARWAAHLYSSDPPWPLQIKPGMLAEWFAVTQVTQTPELAGLLRAMTPAQKAALLVLFAHASDHISRAVQLFADIVAADTARLAEAGVAAALTASAGRPRLDGELASLIGKAVWSADALGRIEDQLIERLPRTRGAVAEARVKIVRADGDVADLAAALHNLGTRLSDLGRYREALAAAEEAVGLWRPLVRDNPAQLPDLARALDNLGTRLTALGRYREALAAAEESVGLWRALALENPDQYQETYNRELAQLRRDLHLHGQETASIRLHLDDDSSDRDKPHHVPPTPNLPEG